MNLRELAVQVWLAEHELESGEFQWRLIQAKISNKQLFIKLREPLTAERFNMTPQEELYAKFFRDEKEHVANLSDEELRERIEEWQVTAFEARARLYANKHEEDERKAKRRATRGFSATVDGDISSEAINTINARSKKLSKREKLIQGLVDMGVDRAVAETMVPDTEKVSKGKAASTNDKLAKLNETITPTFNIAPTVPSRPIVPGMFDNIFAKKDESNASTVKTTSETTVTIIDESTTVIKETITETKDDSVSSEKKLPFTFINPFSK